MKFAAGVRDSITEKPYFYVSDCGCYTVTIPRGEESVYLAFKVSKDKTRPSMLLGGYESSKLAKAACEKDQRIPRT